jgi:uncharacterized protein (DUF885 family)
MNDTTTESAETLRALGERYFHTRHTYDPYNATLLGLAEFDHLPGDPSVDASQAAVAEFDRIGGELAALDTSALGLAEGVDHQVLTVLVRGAAGDAHHSLWAANASAKSYVSRQGLIFQTVPAMTISSAGSADRYLARLSGIGATLTALGERYAVELAQGRAPTALNVTHAIQQLDGYLALPLDQDALLKPTLGAAEANVRERALDVVARSVRPAMAALAERMRSQLLPLSRPDDRAGIMHIPNGEVAYLDAVAQHTTTALGPEEIHAIGLEVLEELDTRWREIGSRALGVADFPTIAERMRSDPALRFRTSDEIVAVAEAALERATAVRARYYPDYAIPDCVIEQINPIDAHNTALAYYRPPAVDGSRPGAHCLLATNPGSRFRYEYECLAFHESVPGHHLQLSIAQLLDIPRYRRHLDVEACGFNEGWGLYCEQFADEIGLYSDDMARLGMLSFLALRACRLVVDTGIHAFGWSRQRAIEFMRSHTATTESNVRNEIDRYIAWPGQALAYVIGRREILRLRAQARTALGDRFDIAGFHGAVLENGAIPLTVLEQHVRRWQATVAASPETNEKGDQ